MPHPAGLRLVGARREDGDRVDVLIEGGIVKDVIPEGPPGQTGAVARASQLRHRELDLSGYLLLPAPAEPHAHLDKALLATRFPNDSGSLAGAIAATRLAYDSMTVDDVERRARDALLLAASHGFTEVRSHVNCGGRLGNRAVTALVSLRERAESTIGLQLVALIECPMTGRAGAGNRAALSNALEAGVDLVGGAPALDPDPLAALDVLIGAATDAGKDLDLHIDETTDPSVRCLAALVDRVLAGQVTGRVTASHCVSLGTQPAEDARDTARQLAQAGIGVVTLPQTNLYLQGRDVPCSQPRGLTAIATLRQAGALVAGGGDNWRDPFNPLGRIDPLETASLLVSAGQLSVADAYRAVSHDARTLMGLPAVTIEPGQPADLLAIKAESLADAIAAAPADRVVIRHGCVLSHTETRHIVRPSIAPAGNWPDM